METIDRLYSVQEALPLLGLKLTKFYSLLEKGELQALKNGSKTVIRESEIIRYRNSLQTIGRKPDDAMAA
jgi:excisionase family DNA binding protein